ncbi:acyl-CoA dehydrogenase [Actinoallomurus sp. NPDC050550]|uniref:acyl-CoA dehydrogenase family protein n=1 Tax=Actinoallomurus sp. NPDC050550 TaxID=3154937 RepID=UPI0033FF8FE9
MTPTHLDVSAGDRVLDYTRRFQRFHEDVVVPLEVELARQKVGTPWQPALDDAGRMHPQVWQARREVQRRAAAAGLYAPHIPVSLGGGGFSRMEMMHVEEFVYHTSGLGLGLAALAWTEGPAPHLVHAGAAVRRDFVEPLMSGEITAAFANTEPDAGSDVLGMRTRAERRGSGWVLSGRKAWITNAPYCDAAQVVAVTEPGAGTRSLTMFLVEADRPGFRRGPDNRTILDDGMTGELILENVQVPDENRIGEVGQGFAIAMTFINWRRVCRGGMCAGWNRLLVERAVRYAKARQYGGEPIAALQSVRHQLADMEADRYSARATSLMAQAELDELGPFAVPLAPAARRLISVLKVVNDEAFFRIADRAVQIHGAAGLRLGSVEEKLFRLARNLRIPAGTVEIQRNAIARELVAGA